MKEILEKIKGLDRNVQIAIGVASAVMVVFVIALVIGLNGSKNNGNKQDVTEIDSQLGTEVLGTEVIGTEVLETEMLETEMLETEMQEIEVNGTEVDGTGITDGSGSNSDKGSTNDEVVNGQLPSGTTNPSGEEILGSGKETTPYMEILGEDYKVTTVEIGVGQSVYYDIYRVGGMCLKIDDANAYVIYNGKRYDAKNGVVSLKVGNALASSAVRFEIGNNGSSSKSFTLKFSYPTGTRENPTVIDSMGTYNISLSYGNEVGHYYKYKAEKSGTIRFYITGTNPCEMSVMNNRNSANRTFEADAKTDEQGKKYIELKVNAGDIIMIQVVAKVDANWEYPATDITWSGEYR